MATLKANKSRGLLTLEHVTADIRHWGKVSDRDYPGVIARLERAIRELSRLDAAVQTECSCRSIEQCDRCTEIDECLVK